MDATPWTLVGVAVMAASLLLIPLGLPGTWIMVAVLGIGAYFGKVHLLLFFGCLLMALVAELAEYWVGQRVNLRYGGSNRAFWGAILGGFLGVLVGIPVPVVGSVIAGILGAFAGAAAVTFWETREWRAAGRVGWGTVIARVLATGFKTAVGLAILVLGAASLLLQ